ncbi:lamin tail domain-containing protein [Winogradskyella luteola]|uniref:Lamin tail domain-containing protein n=1 Tax=Winogradskyella luteola TaxID=2828330 RepID=A0A9X1F7T6_9FLAO|nr:lamin tail domain-containing protein [Winogradskyella luteola]MBV7268921.1 lamin tail domain-containing protein [Winogradskyella luteola]
MKKLYFLLFATLISAMSFGQTLYDADFSTDGDGFADHTTASPPAAGPASVTGGAAPNDWVLRYDTEPATDGTANSFSVSGGALVSDDWGGVGIFESASIDVSLFSNVNISAITQVTGANGDIFSYFYILDGGSRVETVMSDFSSDLIYSVSSLDVSGATSLVVGFEFDENGSGDGYTTTSFKVENAACGVVLQTATYTCNSNTIGDDNDSVNVNVPYTGSNIGITSVTTTSGGTVGGDNPASFVDGTIVITGLSEGDTWDVILNGGDCDMISVSGTVPSAECDPIPNTCFDLSGGSELFELVTVVSNSDMDEWSESSGTYSMNGFCGGGCMEESNTWLIFGPLDMTGVSDLSLIFDAAEGFDGSDLDIQYTSDYSSLCPDGATWTSAQVISDPGSYNIDLSAATGTDVFIGIQYLDSDGSFSSWDVSNVELAAFGTCPTLGVRPTSACAVCDVVLQTESYTCATNTDGDNNDGVTINIPYTGSEATITSVTTTTSGAISGDDPAAFADGTITITGLSEGDAWDLTINGGDCDGTTISGTVPAAECDPETLLINEVNADPSNAAGNVGDANGDGTADANDDEFIEFYNNSSSAIDLSDYTIEDAVSVRYTFPLGTILQPNSFLTVFGGGTPTGISGTVLVSSGPLSLNNGGDTITIRDGGGTEVLSLTYSNAGNNQSIGRAPDFTGSFVDHSSITGNGGALFSPGLENDDATLSNGDFTATAFSIYPNPTNGGEITISSSKSEAISVIGYDILGKQVLSTTITNNTLDVSNLNTGIYILKITQNNASATKKLVIK